MFSVIWNLHLGQSWLDTQLHLHLTVLIYSVLTDHPKTASLLTFAVMFQGLLPGTPPLLALLCNMRFQYLAATAFHSTNQGSLWIHPSGWWASLHGCVNLLKTVPVLSSTTESRQEHRRTIENVYVMRTVIPLTCCYRTILDNYEYYNPSYCHCAV